MASNYGYSGNYQATTYGAQGGADGGGFMEHGGSQSGSQGTSGGSKYGNDSLRPVTIKQIIDAIQPHPEADFKLDGVVLAQVSFIGQIRSISPQPTNTTYKVDDGTGIIEAKVWADADKITTPNPGLAEGNYVHMYGRMKGFNNKRYVWAHVIRPITDFNEISMHLLEATFVHLYFTRGPPESLASTAKAGGGTKAENDGMFVSQGYGNEQANLAAGAGRTLSQMKPMARKIFQVLQSTQQGNEGLHIHQIANSLGVPVNQVIAAGDQLLEMGVIYSTVDEETWAILEH